MKTLDILKRKKGEIFPYIVRDGVLRKSQLGKAAKVLCKAHL